MAQSSTITLGSEIAAIVQFIIIMAILEPAVQVVTPASFAQNFAALGNAITINYTTSTASKIIGTFNSTQGFAGINAQALQSFGGLSFMIGGFNLLWASFWKFPQMMLYLFQNMFQYLPYFPIAIAGLLSIIFLSYITVINGLKFWSFIQKVSVEET